MTRGMKNIEKTDRKMEKRMGSIRKVKQQQQTFLFLRFSIEKIFCQKNCLKKPC